MKSILAKSTGGTTDKLGRTLVEHTKDLLSVFQTIIEPLDMLQERKEALYVSCLVHDFGKINSRFQERIHQVIENNNDKNIKKTEKEIGHNLLSPAFLLPILIEYPIPNIDKGIIVKSIMLHHGKYQEISQVNFSKVEEAIYYDIIQSILNTENYQLKDIEQLISESLHIPYKIDRESITYDYFSYYNSDIGVESKSETEYRKQQQDYIEVKGFLNLIDHTASERMGQPLKYYFTSEEIAKIDSQLLTYLGKGNQFNEIQSNIVQLKEKNIVITEAFTSAGKTICDDRLTAEKKFYLTPNRISAMSFYSEAIKKYGKENVGVLHGALHFYKSGDNSELGLNQEDIDLARNYSKPYILATVDQIVLSLFKFPNYEKTLVALKGARVCVDEIHLLTPRMFQAFLLLMEYATIHLDTKFHLMTATLPPSYKEKLDKVIKNCTNSIQAEYNLGKDVENTKKVVVINDKRNISQICQEAIKNNQQVLIIRNAIDDVIETYNQLCKDLINVDNIQCLHSRFKEEQLKRLYENITTQTGNIWITTQVVEIALDIDFPVVISDLAPMDSLIQRMGRNNRKGLLKDGGKFYLLQKTKYSVYEENLLDITKKIIEKEMKQAVPKNQAVLDMKERKTLLTTYYEDKKVLKNYEGQFKDADKKLRRIFGLTQNEALTGENVFFHYASYKNLTDSKKEAAKYFRDSGMRVKIYLEEDFNEHSHELTGKGITISATRLYALKNKGSIKEIFYQYGSIFILKKDMYVYDEKFGLKFK